MQRAAGVHLLLILCAIPIGRAQAQTATQYCEPAGPAQQAVGGSQPGDGNANCAGQVIQPQSLAEFARNARAKKMAQVQVTPEEAQKILDSVPSVLKFASQDSGLPIHSAVKGRMIAREDMASAMSGRESDDQQAQRLQATELALKKFGYIARDFSTPKFVQGMYTESVAGFYDPRTKVISLLNWVSPEEQLDVLAHELTHALQDQNFNLIPWEQSAQSITTAANRFQVSQAEAIGESEARRAALEGQAMIVLIDHQFQTASIPVRLVSLPGASNTVSQYMSMMPIPDTPTIHASPIFLKDAMIFPYREGLVFELALLGAGGNELAFRKVFARPPLNTHEIMEPQSYIDRENVHAPVIPDLSAILGDKYEVLDSGGLGELDIRSLVKQYNTSRLADILARGWQGSSYLVVKNKGAAMTSATTADVALVFVSAWNSSFTSHKFVEFYSGAVAKRYAHAIAAPSACAGSNCPLESFQFNTEEGFVSVERHPNNLVLITESFDQSVAGAIGAAVLKAGSKSQTASVQDLSLKYADLPIFSNLRGMWEKWIVQQMAEQFEAR